MYQRLIGFFSAVFIVCTALTTSTAYAAKSRPHLPRIGSNILANGNVADETDWYGYTTEMPILFDWNTTHTADGSGSIQLADSNHTAKTPLVSGISEGEVYTIAFYIKSENWPPPIIMIRIAEYFAEGPATSYQWLTLGKITPVSEGEWVEFAIPYTVSAGVDRMRAKLHILYQPVGGTPGSVWLDDFYVGLGIGFEQAPSTKTSFISNRVKVDYLGNMQLHQTPGWKDFFPIVIYPITSAWEPADPLLYWTEVYSEKGFNVVNQARTPTLVARAKDAISSYNPDGMMASFDLDGFIAPSPNNWDATDLGNSIAAIDDSNLLDRIAFYNYDNEHPEQYVSAAGIMAALKTLDSDSPVYMLAGTHSSYGFGRMFTGDAAGSVDLIGHYVGYWGSYQPEGVAHELPHPLLISDRLEGQTAPVFIAQLNPPATTTTEELKTKVYKALVLGAKGISIYSDYRPGGVSAWLEETSWHGNFEDIKDSLDALLPLIKEPHWTTWSTDIIGSDAFVYGTRDLNGVGHIIVANMDGSSSATGVVSVSGLPYTATTAADYFTWKKIDTITNGSFTLPLDAHGTAVVVLADSTVTVNETVKLASTDTAISIEWDILGDSNHNATVAVDYRETGNSTWIPAHPLFRVDFEGIYNSWVPDKPYNMFAGSILGLNAYTDYEIRLTLTDLDGGAVTTLQTVKTQAASSMASGTCSHYVTTGTSGGTGTYQDPYQGLGTAEAAASSGDVVCIFPGNYNDYTFTKSGSATNYITWRNEPSSAMPEFSSVTLNSVSYLYFEKLSFAVDDETTALVDKNAQPNGSHHIVISNCNFSDYDNAISVRGNWWVIKGNTLTGTVSPADLSGVGVGIYLGGTEGIVVRNNTIELYKNAIRGGERNSDYEDNLIRNIGSVGISLDNSYSNIRIQRNRIHNTKAAAVSFQPMYSGPHYFVRNQFISGDATNSKAFLFKVQDQFLFVNNTVIERGRPLFSQAYLHTFSRNNIFVQHGTNNPVWWAQNCSYSYCADYLNDLVADWRTNVDYDGFVWTSTYFAYWYGYYSTIASFTAVVGIEENGITMDSDDFDDLSSVPTTGAVPDAWLILNSAGAGVDGGVTVPNVNMVGVTDGTPDLGAVEYVP